MKPSRLTQNDIDNIIYLYESGLSTRKIEKFTSVKRTRINTILNNNNVKMKGNGNSYSIRKYEFDQGFFDIIDTKNKAYWLGFIAADGHVSDDGLIIGLAKKDFHHLEKFKKDIGYTGEVKEHKRLVWIALYSRKLVDTLRNYGFYKDKSYSLNFPKIPDGFIKSFILGYFDGDGCLSISKNKSLKGKNPNYSMGFCGTYNFMLFIRTFMVKYLNLYPVKIFKMKNTKCLYTITWGGNRNVLNILNWLYDNSTVYLQRKFDRYLSLKTLPKVMYERHSNYWTQKNK